MDLDLDEHGMPRTSTVKRRSISNDKTETEKPSDNDSETENSDNNSEDDQEEVDVVADFDD